MKAIYLCANAETVKSVYSPEARAAISALSEGDTPILDAAQLEAAGGSEAGIVFSTWGMPTLATDKIKALLPNLTAVLYAAGSVQSFARPFLELGIRVSSAWGANAVPVAEFTAAQVALAAKGYFELSRSGSPRPAVSREAFGGCSRATRVGIIGLGMIGRMVAQKLRALRFEVCAYDAFLPDPAFEELGVARAGLEELFSTCRIITNHLANNAQTEGMLGYLLFSLMGEHSVFINTARGAQVVEEELCRALRELPSRFALLDVTYPEPPLEGSPLYELPNVILSPHIAGSLGGECELMGDCMVDEYRRLLNGKEPLREVTLPMLTTMA